MIRRLGRGDLLLAGDGEDPLQRVVDPLHLEGGLLLVVPAGEELEAHVDDAAGVDDVVRGVRDAALQQLAAVAGLLEDVVGAAGDDLALELREGAIVHRRAEGAGGVDVHLLSVDRVGLADARAELLGGRLHAGPVHVADHEVAARLHEAPPEVEPHVADALDGDPGPLEVLLPQHLLGEGLDAEEHPVGGERGGVAGAALGAGAAGDPVGLLADPLHVLDGGAHVLGGDVAAPEGLDEGPHGAEDLRLAVPLRVPEDDRLPAAEAGAGDGRLVGHPPGEAEDVGQRLDLRLVGPHPQPAQGRPEGRVVDRDDGLEPDGRILPHHDLLVAGDGDVRDLQGHGGDSFLRCADCPAP